MDKGQTGMKQTLASVSRYSGTRQVRDARGRWSWVEHSVWTEAMLTALDKGVKGGKWYFREVGLLTITEAHQFLCQSLQRY